MGELFDTTYISVDLASNHGIFRAKVGKGGISVFTFE